MGGHGQDMAAAWLAVADHADRLRPQPLRALIPQPGRPQALTAALDDLTLDLTKEKLDAGALAALIALAEASGAPALRDAMADGKPVNNTENRPALHMALRGSVAPDAPGVSDVAAVRSRFLAFAEAVRSGAYAAADGGAFTDVINIGIGGSDLGPVMAVRALAADADGPRVHFVSNVDGAHLADVTRGLDPARTMVIVASKTFTTQETMTNAHSARAWLRAAAGEAGDGHLAAVSTNLEACAAFGVPGERVFGFWDWVGGRYSLWGAIGLPIAMATGAAGFERLLAGAAAMDRHFLEAPLEANLPFLLGMVGVWRRAMGWPTVALIPYDQRLERFPAYVQQLDMESLGKGVARSGAKLERPSGPVIWGEPGTNAQHSFFQLLHQGTDVIPVEFILAAEPRERMDDHHEKLVANCLAQSAALAFGRTEEEARAEMAAKGMDPAEIARLAPHRAFPGDRPSLTILHRRLDAFALGRLIALYEHRVFVEAAVWGINPFDQWGVELGKAMANDLLPAVKGGDASGFDAGTRFLLERLAALSAG